MKTALLDLNTLIALAWPNHVHHHFAHAWFKREAKHGWATCPLTESGFLRLSSNPRIIPEAVSVNEALAVLKMMTNLKHHMFWPDDLSWIDTNNFPFSAPVHHRQITDAYLLALAIHRKGRLVTFDQNIPSLLPAHSTYTSSLVILQ
jgi:uncharacterized protein